MILEQMMFKRVKKGSPQILKNHFSLYRGDRLRVHLGKEKMITVVELRYSMKNTIVIKCLN